MEKNEKLQLIDAETNISYEIIVSKEDAEKVSRDIRFAETLLLQAKRYAQQESILSKQIILGEDNEDANNPGPSQPNKNQNSNENNECSSGSYNWNRAETLLLISIYKDIESDFTSGKMTQKQCWNKVAQMMQTKGVNISAQKCSTKYQTLKRTYRTIKDHNGKSGNSRKTWEYYEVMDELCRDKPWMDPLAVAGSNIETTDTTEDEKENKKEKTNSKKKINHIFEEYATNCLNEKKLKREAAEKRHKEKMQILNQMENLLQKMINNQNN